MTKPLRNLITDVTGILVGNASDERLKSGVTVVLAEDPAIASIHVMGGAPGTRESDLLAPEQTVTTVDAIVLSGGSAFGLDAGGGAMAGLAAQGRGLAVGPARVPLAPTAILFDLLNGGDKQWGERAPYFDLGRSALANTSADFVLGSVGAGTGATTNNIKGGLGSASARLDDGTTVGAIVAVNALGQATIGETGHFWAALFEEHAEFGGRGMPSPLPDGATTLRHKMQTQSMENTTIGVIATDAHLTKAEAKRLAVMAHDGFARALWPSHTPYDGDTIFVLATDKTPATPPHDIVALGSAAAACMARAIARGIYEATPAPGDLLPTWRERFDTRFI